MSGSKIIFQGRKACIGPSSESSVDNLPVQNATPHSKSEASSSELIDLSIT